MLTDEQRDHVRDLIRRNADQRFDIIRTIPDAGPSRERELEALYEAYNNLLDVNRALEKALAAHSTVRLENTGRRDR